MKVPTWKRPDFSKQPTRTRYLGHVTGYQPIRVQYFHGTHDILSVGDDGVVAMEAGS